VLILEHDPDYDFETLAMLAKEGADLVVTVQPRQERMPGPAPANDQTTRDEVLAPVGARHHGTRSSEQPPPEAGG
jgi:hypothetical protein